MMRSLFSAVSGLRSHQIRMDVIGNNIANVNTTAFKAARVTFADLFSQTIRGAARPEGERGGTNPQQVGLGSAAASIDTLVEGGNTQNTGKGTDLSISGAGYFIVNDGGSLGYTRAGVFDFDAEGYYTTPDGLRVQGWMADSDGVFGAREAGTLTDIRLPFGAAVPAQATTQTSFAKNLDAGAGVGDSVIKTIDVYDSLGRVHTLTVTFTKLATPAPPATPPAENVWRWEAQLGGSSEQGEIWFNADGTFNQAMIGDYTAPGGAPSISDPLDDAAEVLTINLDFSAITQSAGGGASTVEAAEVDGYPMGELQSVSIDTAGVITGSFSNGITRALAQVGMAAFVNPGGLLRTTGGIFHESNNSGSPQIGIPGSGERGTINPGSLEMSNVDLAQEFVNMITTQRGFQANSRVISSTDEMLQELANIKR